MVPHPFQSLFDRMLDPVLVTDDDRVYVDANPAACALLGRPREDVVGRRIDDFAVDHTDVKGAWHAFLAAGQQQGELRIRRADGTVRRVEFSATADIVPGRHLSVLRDVTEHVRLADARTRAEEQLRRREEELRLALAAGRMGTWTWEIATGEVRWSSELEPIHGFAAGTFPGTFDAYLARVHPDDRAAVVETLERALERKGRFEHEMRVIGTDGTVRWVAGRGEVVADEAGQPARMIGIGMDVTETRRLFEENEASRDQAEAIAEVGRLLARSLEPDLVARRVASSLRALLRGQPSIVYRLAGDGEMVSVAVSGEAGPDFAGTIVIPAGVGIVGRAIRERRAVATADLLTDPEIHLTADVRRRLETATHRAALGVPLLVKDRVIGGILVGDRVGRVFTDDELRLAQTFADQAAIAVENARLYAEATRAQAQLAELLIKAQTARVEAEAANRAKDDFLATLSHELRTPLTAMLGWTRLLGSGTLDAAARTRALQSIERNTRLQAQLIEDLLDISRVASGKLTLDLRPVALGGVVSAAVDALRAEAETKGITLAADIDPKTPNVTAEARRVQQVVSNLVANAVKFTPEGGRVSVRLERRDAAVAIVVADTGKGIAPDFLPHVFDRFRQAETSETRAYGGLGLGLAIVHHIVAAHGGTVGAESAGEDCGSTFTVTLPVADAGERVAREEDPPAVSAAPSLDGVRVLVVEDDDDTRAYLATMLAGRGAEVTAVGSASEALAMLERVAPDVLLSDIAMAGQDGYDLIRKVRLLDGKRGRATPAVALTAFARREDVERALAAGFDRHVAKPVEPADLATIVANLAGRAA